MGEYGYLAHSGRSKRDGAKIGSGRYRLGSGDRPFQHVVGYAAKTARVAGNKIGYAVREYKRKQKAKAERAWAEKTERAKREELKRLEKQQAARQEELERKEKFKREIIESGDMKLVMKNKNILSNEEISEAITRFDTFQALDAKKKARFKSGWEKMDSIFDKVGKINNYSETLIKLYNRVANVHNAFTKDSDSIMPKISTEFTKGVSALQIAKEGLDAFNENKKKDDQKKDNQNNSSNNNNNNNKDKSNKDTNEQNKAKEALEKEVENRETKTEKESDIDLKKHDKAYKKIQNKIDDHVREKEKAERKQALEDNKRAEKEAAEKQKKLEYDKAVFDVNRYGEGPSEPTNKKEYDDVKARSDRALSLINSWSSKSSNSLNDKLMEDLAELKAEGKKGREIIERLDDEEMELFFKMLNSKK